MKNIVLFGFMGCGKSTIGKELGRKTGRKTIDLDEYIEKREGKKISEIFALAGEETFRQMESFYSKELSQKEGMILCCGGGTVLKEENRQILEEKGQMVFLDASFSVCYERIKDSNRPLVKSKTKEELYALYKERNPQYLEVAHIRVDADQPVEQVGKEILCKLGMESY